MKNYVVLVSSLGHMPLSQRRQAPSSRYWVSRASVRSTTRKSTDSEYDLGAVRITFALTMPLTRRPKSRPAKQPLADPIKSPSTIRRVKPTNITYRQQKIGLHDNVRQQSGG